jgi:hypothetical protein
MTYLIAMFVFPVLLAFLAIGAGLLVDRISRPVIPGVLVPPVGLAALVVVSELFAYRELTAPAVPVALVVVSLAGYVAGLPRLRTVRPDWWPIAAGAATYVLVALPVLLLGRATVAGYLLDTTAAFHLLGSDYLLEHARNFSGLPPSATSGTLQGYYGTGYPSGGQTLLGGTGRLVGTDRIWLYQAFLAMLAAFCAPVLYYLGRVAELARPLAAGTAVLASAPALVYAYAQMGAIKELAALPFVVLLGGVLVLLPKLVAGGLRGIAMPAVVVAAGVGVIGFSFAPWVVLAGLAGLVLVLWEGGLVRERIRSLALWIVAFAVGLVVLAIPTFGPLSRSLSLARSLSTSNATAVADPGNLLQPLKPVQMFGVWLVGTHRVEPTTWIQETYALIGLTIAMALLGAVFLVRRRNWPLAAWVVVSAVAWALLTRRGAAWTDAKLLVLTSPVAVLLAGIGVESLRRAGRKLEALTVATAIAAGILVSNAFTYHDTNLAPTDRYEELMDVGKDFAGAKGTLVPEFDEFALYVLRKMAPDGPGFSLKTPGVALLRDGTPTAYGHSYDLDLLSPEVVTSYPLIVKRRRPDSSRPPASFAPAFIGDSYEVWKRTGDIDVIEHLPAGRGFQPASTVRCSAIQSLARGAQRGGGQLAFVPRTRLITVDPARAARPLAWGTLAQGVALGSPGVLTSGFRLPITGRYKIWLEGDFGRALTISIDGRRAGSVGYQSGNEGNVARPLTVSLAAGRHRLKIKRGGGGVRPGNGTPSRIVAVFFEPDAGTPAVKTLPASDWHRLCGRSVDWVEAIRRG